jgi:hypothetical protein
MVNVFIFTFIFGQIDQMSLTTMGFSFFSKGATTSFKAICKCHEQQLRSDFFHFSSKVAQLSSNLTSVVNDDGY